MWPSKHVIPERLHQTYIAPVALEESASYVAADVEARPAKDRRCDAGLFCLAHDTSSMLLTDRAPRHESETAARARKPAASLAILVRADIGRTARAHVDRLCLIAPVVSVLTRLGLAQG
jgi:hypothetical protein